MSMGVPGREGLEQTTQQQFKVGDRVEVIDGHENDYSLGYKGNITLLSDEFARLDGRDACIRQHRLKLLPEEQMVDITEPHGTSSIEVHTLKGWRKVTFEPPIESNADGMYGDFGKAIMEWLRGQR